MPNLLLRFQLPNIFSIRLTHLFIIITIVVSRLVVFCNLALIFLLFFSLFKTRSLPLNDCFTKKDYIKASKIFGDTFSLDNKKKTFSYSKTVYLQTTFAKYSPGVTNFLSKKHKIVLNMLIH